jgi:hypothetical protein
MKVKARNSSSHWFRLGSPAGFGLQGNLANWNGVAYVFD